VRPVMHDGDEVEIVQSRHPVIEAFSEEPFVPNSITLITPLIVYCNHWSKHGGKEHGAAADGSRLHTRPDGKLRAGREGAFATSRSCLGHAWAPRIFNPGRSTFMVEMTETAAISIALRHVL